MPALMPESARPFERPSSLRSVATLGARTPCPNTSSASSSSFTAPVVGTYLEAAA